MKAFRFLLPLFRGQISLFIAALALSLVTLLAGIALLGISGWFLTAAALTTMAASFNLFGPSSLIRGLSLVRILSRYGEKLVGHDATLRLLSDLRTQVFARLFSMSSLPAIGRGDLVSRLTGDIDALEAIFIVGIAPVVTSLLSGVAMAVIITLMLPQALPAYSVAIGCAVIAVPGLLFIACRSPGGNLVKVTAEARSQLLNASDGQADIVCFGQAETVGKAFADACGRLTAIRRSLALRASMASMAIQLLTAAALLSVLLVAIPALRAGDLSAPVLVGLLLATLASFEGAASVVRGVARFGTALAAAGRIAEMTDVVPDVRLNVEPMPDGNRLTLRNVSFGYDPGHPVLRGIDLVVEPGTRIALTGRSGCGKSTLLSLLVALGDVQAGDISLGGVGLARLDRHALQSRIALLAQDAPVFMGSIRDNLLIGDPQADDARLMGALESVRLGQFVRELPDGLGTYVGETGRTLSVGQARRLCLARVLLSRADILLLDEPTSSLDGATEAAFFSDIAQITDGRTIIVATHAPMKILAGFDQRYRMHSGSLAPA